MIGLFTVLFFFAYGGYFIYQIINASENTYQELERGQTSEMRQEEVTLGEDPISILLLGIEDYSTGGQNGRADSLVVATIDPVENTMKLLSIPRDSYVELVGRGRFDKINHAHAFGGTDLTIDTVENFLQIPIDYYVKANFDGFKEGIDLIGGVTVDVPFDFWENSDEGNKRKIHFEEGEMTLTGEESLAYVRMRYRDPRGDLGRNERQKQVIQAAIKEAISASTLLKADQLIGVLERNIETNFRLMDIIGLQNEVMKVDPAAITSLAIKGEDQRINGIYYYVPIEEDLEMVRQALKDHLKH